MNLFELLDEYAFGVLKCINEWYANNLCHISEKAIYSNKEIKNINVLHTRAQTVIHLSIWWLNPLAMCSYALNDINLFTIWLFSPNSILVSIAKAELKMGVT